MITLEQYEQIRRMHYLEEQSARAIARTLGISRQTVTKALQREQEPEYTLKEPRESPRLGPYKEKLETLLEDNGRMPMSTSERCLIDSAMITYPVPSSRW